MLRTGNLAWSIVSLLLLPAMTLGLAPPPGVGPDPGPRPGPRLGPLHPALVERAFRFLDANNDGRIDLREYRELMPQLMKHVFGMYVGGRGSGRPEGPRAGRPAGPGNMPEPGMMKQRAHQVAKRLFQTLDANGDGFVDRHEFMERMPQIIRRRIQMLRQGRGEPAPGHPGVWGQPGENGPGRFGGMGPRFDRFRRMGPMGFGEGRERGRPEPGASAGIFGGPGGRKLLDRLDPDERPPLGPAGPRVGERGSAGRPPRQAMAIFQMFDANRDGALDPIELQRAIHLLKKAKAASEREPVSPQGWGHLFAEQGQRPGQGPGPAAGPEARREKPRGRGMAPGRDRGPREGRGSGREMVPGGGPGPRPGMGPGPGGPPGGPPTPPPGDEPQGQP